eukprot:805319-Pyramimonas_sp.AAC.1
MGGTGSSRRRGSDAMLNGVVQACVSGETGWTTSRAASPSHKFLEGFKRKALDHLARRSSERRVARMSG